MHYDSINYFHSNDSLMNKIGLILLCQNQFPNDTFFHILALNSQKIYLNDNCAI